MTEKTPEDWWPEKDFEAFRDQRKEVFGSSDVLTLERIGWKLKWMRRYIMNLERALSKLSPERVAEIQGWPYNDNTPNPRNMDADAYYADYETERHTRRQQAGYDPI